MTRSASRVLALLGPGLFVAGLLVGLMPVKAGGVSCGGGLWSSGAARDADLRGSFSGGGGVGAACADRRSVVRLVAVPLLVVGAGVGGVGWVGRDDED